MKRLILVLPFVLGLAGCPEPVANTTQDLAVCGNEVCGSNEICCAISCGPASGTLECISGFTFCPVATCDAGGTD